jgi:hypothetical protein
LNPIHPNLSPLTQRSKIGINQTLNLMEARIKNQRKILRYPRKSMVHKNPKSQQPLFSSFQTKKETLLKKNFQKNLSLKLVPSWGIFGKI